MRTEFLCIFVLRVASGPRVKLASCKSALTAPHPPPPPPPHTHTVVCSTDRSKAVVPVLVLLFVVYSTKRFVVCLSVYHFVLVFFSPFSIAITSLGEERANLSDFVFLFGCACLDLSVSSSSWGLGRDAVCDCGTPWTFLLPFL